MKPKIPVMKWLEERLGLNNLPLFKTPDYMYNFTYWTGALVAAAFVLTVVTGALLLLYYNPADPYNQTEYIINQVPYGAVLLYTHLYSAYAMIFLAYLHMYRNYMAGAYKKPREVLWVLGLVMFIATMAASFVGYALVGDVLSVNAVDVSKGLVSAMPGGALLLPMIFGNGTTTSLFTRLLGWHLLLVVLIVAATFVLHFFLAEQHGFMPSLRSRQRAPAVYSKKEEEGFNPWWPRNFVYMMSLVFITWGFLLIVPNILAMVNNLPVILSPQPAPSPTSPLATNIVPYPPWFFLFFYKVPDLLNPGGSPYSPQEVIFVATILPVAFLLLLPFLDRGEALDPFGKQRRLFTWIFVSMLIALIELTLWAYLAPGVPAGFTLQLELLLPPVMLTGIGIFLMETGITAPRLGSATPKAILALVFFALLLAGAINGFFRYPAVYTVGIAVSALFLFITYIRRAGLAFNPETGALKRATPPAPPAKTPAWKLNLAELIAGALFLLAVTVAFSMWGLPSTGIEESFFGVGLGAVLLMLGEVISLYHYVSYSRDLSQGQ